MLAVFEKVLSPDRGWLKRTLRAIFPPSPSGYLEVYEGVPYIRISCEEGKNGFSWNGICDISLDCSGRILMPREIDPPKNCSVKRFVPTVYPQIMLEKMAASALSEANVDPAEIMLALCGDKTEIERMLPVFVNCAAEVRVISPDCDELTAFVEGTSDITGASIMLTRDTSAVDSCNLIIAPSGLPQGANPAAKSLVFADGRRDFEGVQILSADIDIPEWLSPAYRDFYDKKEFLSAFYEIAQAKRLGDLEPAHAVGRGGSISPNQLAQVLNGVCSKNGNFVQIM